MLKWVVWSSEDARRVLTPTTDRESRARVAPHLRTGEVVGAEENLSTRAYLTRWGGIWTIWSRLGGGGRAPLMLFRSGM
eukprot:1179818-Prorocentrum_minimum.AAC.2